MAMQMQRLGSAPVELKSRVLNSVIAKKTISPILVAIIIKGRFQRRTIFILWKAKLGPAQSIIEKVYSRRNETIPRVTIIPRRKRSSAKFARKLDGKR